MLLDDIIENSKVEKKLDLLELRTINEVNSQNEKFIL